MPRPARRIVHLHIPKTAGTALRTAFERHYGSDLRVFPGRYEANFADVEKETYDFFSGHIGFDTARRLDGDVITILRNPVDRFVSIYYFWRQLYASKVEDSWNTQLAARYPLDEFVRITDVPSLIEEFQNRCTFQIAAGSSIEDRRRLRLSGLNDDSIFKLALSNLDQIKVIGIQERLDGFIGAIESTCGVSLDLKPVNVTKERPSLKEISAASRRAIQEWVYLDVELYHEVTLRI